MKDAYYFSHDSNSRHDPKLTSFCSKYGIKGYAYFFMLIELLREQNNYRLPISLKPSITMLWQCYGDVITHDNFEKIYCDMKEVGLLIEDASFIYSQSLNERMAKLDESRAKFSKAGKAGSASRWHRYNDPIALKESKVNKVNKENNTSFNSFWSVYPKKVSKQSALKAFLKLSPSDELLQLILQGVEIQSKTDQWQKDGGQFIPHPVTWLNQRRWEDEVKTNDPYANLPNQKF